MTSRFLVVPQWQGSGSSRAMRLVDGAEAIRGDLPSSATTVVEVPVEAGNSQGAGVQRLSSLLLVRDAQRRALENVRDRVITIGGDCGVELAAIEHAATGTPRLAVVWLDAHPDLNTPESSPSGAFTGMVLRTLLGDTVDALVPAHPLDPSRVVLVGARTVDDPELEYLAATGIPSIDAADASPQAIADALAAMDATAVYLHLDLDALDPAELEGLSDPQPFGLTLAQVLETIGATKAALPLAGAGITGFSPASPDAAVEDLGAILRIVGALAS